MYSLLNQSSTDGHMCCFPFFTPWKQCQIFSRHTCRCITHACRVSLLCGLSDEHLSPCFQSFTIKQFLLRGLSDVLGDLCFDWSPYHTFHACGVSLQCGLSDGSLIEGLATLLTRKSLLSCVNSSMNMKICVITEAFATCITYERFLPSMNSLMIDSKDLCSDWSSSHTQHSHKVSSLFVQGPLCRV